MKHKLAFLRLFRSFVGRSVNRNAVRTVCLALFLSISFSAYSQITISFKEQPLRSALKQIEQVSAYKFFYNESLPDLDRKVSLNVQDATIDQTMRQLLAKTALSYKQEQGNVIALIRKPAQNASSAKKITGIWMRILAEHAPKCYRERETGVSLDDAYLYYFGQNA